MDQDDLLAWGIDHRPMIFSGLLADGDETGHLDREALGRRLVLFLLRWHDRRVADIPGRRWFPKVGALTHVRRYPASVLPAFRRGIDP
jgi:hypothetical protein